jgi:hypothetical protein
MVDIVQTGRRTFTAKAQHVLLYGTLGSGAVRGVSMDESSHGLVIIDHVHHEIHAGDAYRYNDPITLASAATQDYLLTVADTAKNPHFTFSVDGTAITTIEVFESSDRTGTTLQTTFNADRNSANTAGMTIHKGTSGGTTDGTSIFEYSSGTASGSSKLDGVAAYDSERILKRNTKYIIRVTSGTNGNLVNTRMEWYEHTSAE